MKVLVTGSNGFIGLAVREELAARGHEYLSFDAPHDIRHAGELEVAAGLEAEGIINLAGVLGTSELHGRQHHAAWVNILGAVNVYELGATLNIPVVQIGTGHRGQPNTYAITKAAAEDLALARAQWGGERIAVVRAYHVYGPGQKPCAPHGPSPVRKIFPSFTCRALTGMALEVYGDGSQRIDMVHVTEVAKVLVDALDGPYGEVTEAGTGRAISVLDVALDIAVATGSDSHVLRITAGRPGEPLGADVVASKPVVKSTWPYLMCETIDWYRNWLAGYQQQVR